MPIKIDNVRTDDWLGLYYLKIDGSNANTNINIGTFDLTTTGDIILGDDSWIGIGVTSPRIVFDDTGGKEINFQNAGVYTFDDAVRFDNKAIFTQVDGNEYIDSLNDGYMDYGATTAHRFLANIEMKASSRRIYFGGSNDSYIENDGGALNIVGQATPTPTDIKFTAADFYFTGDSKRLYLGATADVYIEFDGDSWNFANVVTQNADFIFTGLDGAVTKTTTWDLSENLWDFGDSDIKTTGHIAINTTIDTDIAIKYNETVTGSNQTRYGSFFRLYGTDDTIKQILYGSKVLLETHQGTAPQFDNATAFVYELGCNSTGGIQTGLFINADFAPPVLDYFYGVRIIGGLLTVNTAKWGLYIEDLDSWLGEDDIYTYFGTGKDGRLYVNSDHFYIENVTQDMDIVLKIDDGGVAKTITWDADVDKLKHSAGTFDFDNDNITTTGNIRIDSDSSVLDLGDVTGDYTIGWDGDDAVHTITAGDFVFTGGNVGIGTATPVTPLQIESALNALTDTDEPENYHLLIRNPASDLNEGVGIAFLISGLTDDVGASIINKRVGDNAQSQLQFWNKQNTAAGGVLTQAMTLDENGNVGIGIVAPTEKLDVLGQSIVIGGDLGSYVARTDSTDKLGELAVPHYLNAEQAIEVFNINSAVNYSILSFGGAVSNRNAVTQIRFYAASNTTTVTGTNRMTIYGYGDIHMNANLGIGDATPDGKLEVRQTAAADIFNLYDNTTNVFTVLDGGNVGIKEVAPQDTLEVNGTILVKDKLKFTQDDGDEYIDSLADGFMDYGATTAHRFLADVKITSDTLKIYRGVGDDVFDYFDGSDWIFDISGATADVGEPDFVFKLNDNAAASKFYIIDSDEALAATIDSDGNMVLAGFLQLTQKAGTAVDGDLWNDSTQEALQTFTSGIEQTLVGCIFTQTADQTIADTTDETSLFGTGVGTLTLPANFWVVGKTIRIEIHGDFADTGNPTARIKVKLDTVECSDSTAITLSGLGGIEEWETEVIMTCRSTGGSGTIETVVDWEYETTTGSSAIERLDISGTLQTVNTTQSDTLDVTFQWGTANALNTLHSHVGFVTVLN